MQNHQKRSAENLEYVIPSSYETFNLAIFNALQKIKIQYRVLDP